jgi:hypothetical protein
MDAALHAGDFMLSKFALGGDRCVVASCPFSLCSLVIGCIVLSVPSNSSMTVKAKQPRRNGNTEANRK